MKGLGCLWDQNLVKPPSNLVRGRGLASLSQPQAYAMCKLQAEIKGGSGSASSALPGRLGDNCWLTTQPGVRCWAVRPPPTPQACVQPALMKACRRHTAPTLRTFQSNTGEKRGTNSTQVLWGRGTVTAPVRKGSALVRSGCCDKVPDWVAYQQQLLLSQSWRPEV